MRWPLPKIIKYCQRCGKKCKRNRRHTRMEHAARKFCSSECSMAARKDSVVYRDVACKFCKKDFETLARAPADMCSKKCIKKYFKKLFNKRTMRKCKECGKRREITQAALRTTPFDYCSPQCFGTSQRDPEAKGLSSKRFARYKNLKYQYGMTLEDYDEMVEKQSGCCAICSDKPKKTLHVDHDHKTGDIRGLLCSKCNQGLGMLGDNKKGIAKALAYLEKIPKKI